MTIGVDDGASCTSFSSIEKSNKYSSLVVYRRQQRRSTDTQTHPTFEKILNTAIDVLLEQGFDLFSVQEVLDRAQVSRGTLYHHFGDVDALIEAALAGSYSREVAMNRAAAREVIERCKTATEYRREIKRLVMKVAELPPSVRIRRVHTIALCQTRPYLADAIRAEQDFSNREWEDLVELAQSKGFLRQDVDPRVAAAILQAVGISRVVDEVSTDPLSDQQWAELTFEIFDRMLFSPPK